ncbi:MAG: DUF1501 domain-containing protein [Phycisphaeraceae bacterium]|nr:MAG: DUF1501 domain-containing protein [Phycisphaeraceae bacterium]
MATNASWGSPRGRCTGNACCDRRSFLRVGTLGGFGTLLGLGLPEFLRLEAIASAFQDSAGRAAAGPRAKSVIHIFLPGGMAHQDTFDPKPYSPVEYRGGMEAIATTIDGVQFGRQLPRIAQIADRMTIIRSFTHGEAAHERGTHNMFTGYRPSPAIVYPSMGSVVSHELGGRNNLPPYVCVPSQPTTYAGSGYLSSSYAPFSVGSDPAAREFIVRDLNLPNGVDEARFTRRRRLLDAVNAHFEQREKSDDLDAMDSFYARAYDLLASPEAREAFNLGAEPDAMRDGYGRNQAGQRMLLARRLVEAGVRFVSLTYGGWDMHQNILEGLNSQLPPFDQALAALIGDLEARGLLDSTLVMVTTEFGRTPRLNPDGGRDHWPRVFSIALAGGGVKRGLAYGRSDATAAEPDSDPVGPEDLARTMFTLLGIDPDKRLMAPGDRPIDIVRHGRVLTEILA